MTDTRQQIRDLCRRRLGDLAVPYKWSDLQINQWINDAIADYSLHFPRTLVTVIACTAGVQVYDLPERCYAVLAVEYPKAEDPPRYLILDDPYRAGFYADGQRYAVKSHHDASEANQLVVSSEPLAGEEIAVTYLSDHAYPDDDADEITIPERHYELIMLYVRWAAFQELATTESSDPDPTSLALSTLELNAYRAQRLYLQSLEKAKEAGASPARIDWVMDRWDRVY